MSVALHRGVGEYQASLPHASLVERTHKPSVSKRGALLFAGLGGDEMDFYIEEGASDQKDVDTAYLLAESGIPTASIAVEALWGNTAMQTRITNMRTYAQADWGFASGTVFLLAASGGCLAALNWARNNPTVTAAVALIVPATELGWFHDNGYEASIDAAYTNHAGYLAALPTHSPGLHPEAYADIPIKAWISDNDTTAPHQLAKDFIDAVPDGERVSLGNVGHVAANSAVDFPRQIVDFFLEHTEMSPPDTALYLSNDLYLSDDLYLLAT